jgi:hypothetical protein
MSSKNISSSFYHPSVVGHFRTSRAFKSSISPNHLFPRFPPGRPKNIYSPFYCPSVVGHFRTSRASKYSTSPNHFFPCVLPGRPPEPFLHNLIILYFFYVSDFCNSIRLLVLNNSRSGGIPRIINTALVSYIA